MTKERIRELRNELKYEIKQNKNSRKMFDRLIKKIINNKNDFKNPNRFTIIDNGGYIQYNLEMLTITEPIVVMDGAKFVMEGMKINNKQNA